ncbi:MAG: hypothetical protein IKY52_02380 [Clostridia bacterium]|nr:hypothetical protein [Clostridia bacterium]
MRIRRLTALLLTLVMFCTGLPLSAQADTHLQDSMEGEIAFAGRITDYLINPLYEELTLDHFPLLRQLLQRMGYFSAESRNSEESCSYDAADDTAQTYIIYSTTVESAASKLRDGIIDRQEKITVGITNAVYETLKAKPDGLFKELFYASYAHDPAEPRAGDYIRYTYGGWSASGTATTSGVKLEYTMQYYTTAEEEEQVDAMVDTLVTAWQKQNLSDYEQICAIYDYITGHVTYDNAGLEAYSKAVDDGTLTMEHCKIFTAYGALVNGTSVCQGYTNLFYRLALEMGLDARTIKSIPAENHVWNIAALDELYYNLDATWDAGEKDNGYRYFLLNMEDFVNHTRNAEYDADFDAAYPMSPVSYGAAEPEDPVDPEDPEEPNGMPGDLNEDGIVSGKDLLILRYVLAERWDKSYSTIGADTNGDGETNGMDLILLRQYLAEWDVVLGAQPVKR